MTRLRTKIYLAIARIWGTISLKLAKFKPAELRVRVGERIVEYPFIFKNIRGLKKGRILDVGCCGSYFITQLAALGHEVHGIDIRRHPVKFPKVKTVQGDIRKTTYPNDFFDVVIAISTLEHIGIESKTYGIRHEDPEGDKKAIREMTRILKPNGKMIVTLPYGKGKRVDIRTYNAHSLKELLSGLKIEVIEFYVLKNEYWIRVPKAEAEKIEQFSFVPTRCVVLLKLSKK